MPECQDGARQPESSDHFFLCASVYGVDPHAVTDEDLLLAASLFVVLVEKKGYQVYDQTILDVQDAKFRLLSSLDSDLVVGSIPLSVACLLYALTLHQVSQLEDLLSAANLSVLSACGLPSDNDGVLLAETSLIAPLLTAAFQDSQVTTA